MTKSDNLQTYPKKKKLLTIRTTTSAETQALLSSKSFGNHDATFALHTTLNTTVATVLADAHQTTPLHVLGEELAHQGVLSIRRQITPAKRTILYLTFDSTTEPEHIYIHRPNPLHHPPLHVPLPLRCKKCQRHGHRDAAQFAAGSTHRRGAAAHRAAPPATGRTLSPTPSATSGFLRGRQTFKLISSKMAEVWTQNMSKTGTSHDISGLNRDFPNLILLTDFDASKSVLGSFFAFFAKI